MPKSRRSKFLTTIEAAEYLRLVPHTLENMRWMRIGPDYRKHGGRVFYDLDELKAWSERQRAKPPGAKAPTPPESAPSAFANGHRR